MDASMDGWKAARKQARAHVYVCMCLLVMYVFAWAWAGSLMPRHRQSYKSMRMYTCINQCNVLRFHRNTPAKRP